VGVGVDVEVGVDVSVGLGVGVGVSVGVDVGVLVGVAVGVGVGVLVGVGVGVVVGVLVEVGVGVSVGVPKKAGWAEGRQLKAITETTSARARAPATVTKVSRRPFSILRKMLTLAATIPERNEIQEFNQVTAVSNTTAWKAVVWATLHPQTSRSLPNLHHSMV